MTAVRESIARKVQAGGAASLTAEEAVDVLKMIHELGKHEAAAISHQREKEAHAAVTAAKDREITGLQSFIAKERRTIRDMFICAAAQTDRSPEACVDFADRLMTAREVRRV